MDGTQQRISAYPHPSGSLSYNVKVRQVPAVKGAEPHAPVSYVW